MIAGIADTHTALWHLYDDERLSLVAGHFIDQAAAARRRIVVSAISLAEIVYLIEKNRLPANVYADLKSALSDPDHVLKEAPFTVEIVDAMRQVPRAQVSDMPDRIVAATAVHFGVPILSRDGRILQISKPSGNRRDPQHRFRAVRRIERGQRRLRLNASRADAQPPVQHRREAAAAGRGRVSQAVRLYAYGPLASI